MLYKKNYNKDNMTTKNTKWLVKNLSIKDLSLWDENARFPEEYFKKNDTELLEYFLSKREFKIDNLAKEIVGDFDLPQLEKLVVLELGGKNIVIEGNRRLTVYKLLANPNLIKNRKDLKKLFEEYKKSIGINDSFALESTITKEKDEALRFVDRKHNKGNNEVGWGEPERRNFAIRRSNGKIKDIIRVELANAVKKLSLPDAIKEAVLGKGFVTTFYRLVDNSAARSKFGYDISTDGNLEIKDRNLFDNYLKIVAYDVWQKKDSQGNQVDSRSLNKTEDITNYINGLKKSESTNIDKEINKNIKKDLFGGEAIFKGSGTKSKPVSTLRKHLILSSLYINNNRINDIYNELKKKLEVDSTPNAVAVLFRVFIECSVDYYIEVNKIKITDKIELAGKILKTVDHLEAYLIDKYFKDNKITNPTEAQKKSASQKLKFKEMRKMATKDNNSILSVSTFHDFVHDYKTSPVACDLKKYWDNIDNFFVEFWKQLSEKNVKNK